MTTRQLACAGSSAALPKAVDTIGEQALFYGETIRYIPNALTRYRKETIRLISPR